MRILWRLLVLCRPYLGWLLLGILAALVTLLSNLALLAISGWFIASMALAGAAGVSMNYFTPAAMIRATAILRTAGRYVERLITHEATFRLLAGLRVWFYRQLEPLAPAGLERYRSGDLLSRIRADIDSLDNFYIRGLVPVSVALLGVSLLTLVMFGYDSLLALLLLALLLCAGLLLPLLTGFLGRHPGEQRVLLAAELRSHLVDGVQGLAELTVCGAVEASAQRIDSTGRELIETQRRLSRVSGLSQAGLLLCANLALWLVVMNAVPLVHTGTLAPAELALLALLSLAAFEAVMPLPEALRVLGETLTAARRLFSIADQAPPVIDPVQARQAPDDFSLRLQGVDFRYREGSELVLRQLDLELPCGARQALLGPTGSGKSSLIQLLLRLRTCEAGQISLGGAPLEDYRSEDLRRWIAVVPQQVYLFNTSIRENLRLADPQADQARLEQACHIAQIHDFIQGLPEGYDTWVGETGVRLSGGQARRIAIARALVREFRLLVLDEPGEGLDAATEQALLASLHEHLGERGLLLITHRPGGLQRMQHILLLDEGRLMEQGSPEELLARPGPFTALLRDSLPIGDRVGD